MPHRTVHTETQPAAVPTPAQSGKSQGDEQDQISLNIAAVHDFYDREDSKLNHSQRIVESVSGFVGQPVFLAVILAFIALWITANALCSIVGWDEFDPAPYFWLQGIIGVLALLTATVVLSKQNRLAKLAEQRANLDLKVTLLTEQKTAKMIHLLEELRRDLPNVRDRLDADAATLQNSMTPSRVLEALDEVAPSAQAPSTDSGA